MLRELSKVEQRYDAVLAVTREGMRVTEPPSRSGSTPSSFSTSARAIRRDSQFPLDRTGTSSPDRECSGPKNERIRETGGPIGAEGPCSVPVIERTLE